MILDEEVRIVVGVGMERFGSSRGVEEVFEGFVREVGGRGGGEGETNCTRRIRGVHSLLVFFSSLQFHCGGWEADKRGLELEKG